MRIDYDKDQLAYALANALKERDEAREEIKEWKTLCLWGGTPEHIHGFIRGQQSRIQHLERERDEAMEKHATEATEHMLAINKICNDRDDAREEVRLLKGILDLIKKEAQVALRRICDLATDGYLKASDHRGLIMQISDISREKAAK